MLKNRKQIILQVKYVFVKSLLLLVFQMGICSLLQAQCSRSEPIIIISESFETGLPAGWEAPVSSDGANWHIDSAAIGYFENPGEGKWIYVNDESSDEVGEAKLTSAIYDLSQFGPASYLEFDMVFQNFAGVGESRIEAWDGKEWVLLNESRNDFTGRVKLSLQDFRTSDFRMRFTYNDDSEWGWGMGIDNFTISEVVASCGNNICELGEDPKLCPEDCAPDTLPHPFWIETGQDLEGNSVRYAYFKGNTPCDDCSDEVNLGFKYNFFDEEHEVVFINSNGNLSLDKSHVEFTPEPFCLTGPAMIAPFFADVDLNKGGEIRYYHDPEKHYLIVSWIDVAYYGCKRDCPYTNTFQCILTDGSVSQINGYQIPQGVNTIFTYQDMVWTTGTASGGKAGFIGSAATVGLNYGDGRTCEDYGIFDHAGYEYYGNFQTFSCPPNGVSHLDHRCIMANADSASFFDWQHAIILSGYHSGSNNVLTWNTVLDSEDAIFEIRRFKDSTHYEVLETDYSYLGKEGPWQKFGAVDTSSRKAHSTYQIAEIYPGGNTILSSKINLYNPALSLVQLQALQLISLGPNPFSQRITLKIKTETDCKVQLLLSQLDGRVVHRDSWAIPVGTHSRDITLPSLPQGNYICTIVHPWGKEARTLVKVE